MKKKKMLFIYNPHAGKATIKTHLVDILDIFVKADYEVTVYPTQCSGDAASAAKNRKKSYDLVVCSGGDGTLDEVVSGIMASGYQTAIGYVPAGSTNDFANSLHLPRTMTGAAAAVVGGVEFRCDVGTFNHDYFVYIAAFGLFTDVSYETKQEMKNVLGHMAYVLEGMKRLSTIKSYPLTVQYEETVIEGEFIFGMVTNSVSVGGFKRITGKWVELNDGMFEVTLIKKPRNPMELNSIASALILKDIDTEYMYCFKTNHVTFEAKGAIPWTLDGEFGGRHQNVEITNLKQAIAIMTPS